MINELTVSPIVCLESGPTAEKISPKNMIPTIKQITLNIHITNMCSQQLQDITIITIVDFKIK
jgi:hypothetical protein